MKIDNTNNTILSLMVLGILIIPILSLDYVDDRYKEIVTDQSNLNYENLNIDYVNKTEFETFITPHALHSLDWANDSNLIGLFYHGLGLTDVVYSDNITYVGNNTYYIQHSELPYTHRLLIPLNLTTHNLSSYDTVLMYSENEAILGYFDNAGDDNIVDVEAFEIAENQFLNIISLDEKFNLKNSPDYQVFVQFQPLFVGDNCNLSIEYGIIKEDGVFTVSDETYYYIILTSTIAISLFTLIFISNTVDIIFDYKDNRKNKWRK